jgi:hypothetical protein
VLALASAVLPVAAGVLYVALPWQEPHRAAVIPPSPIELEQRRSEPVRAEVVPIGGFATAPASTSRPVPVVVTLTISSRCELRVVADGMEILSRVMQRGGCLATRATSCQPASAATIIKIFSSAMTEPRTQHNAPCRHRLHPAVCMLRP